MTKYGCWVALAMLWVSARALAQKTDVVVLDNGDHVTGEVTGLYRGVLTLSTSHMGTVRIQWEHVDEITSTKTFEIELESGERLLGSLRPGDQKGTFRIVGDETDDVELLAAVELAPIEKSFWAQVDGSTSVGFSFAQSNAVTTLTVAASANYRAANYLTAVGFNSYFNNQEGADSTRRSETTLSLSRFYPNRWFVTGLTQFLQSDELGLAFRTTAGGAVGRHVIETNKNILSPIAGIVYGNSVFLDDIPSRNEILAITGFEYSLITFAHHKPNFTTAFYFLPSLTESGHVRLELNSSFSVEIFANFYWSVNLYENFDNDPPPGAAQNDFGVSTSLGWSF